MKLSKVFSAIFGVLGTVLMVAAIVACLWNQGKKTTDLPLPEEARHCADTFCLALATGDYDTANGLLYGGGSIGMAPAPADPVGKLVWERYTGILTFTLDGEGYAEGSSFYQKLTVTALDIPSATAELTALAQEELEKKTAGVEDPTELYGADNRYRQELIDGAVLSAARRALDAGEIKTYTVTLQLVQQDGVWRVNPDGNLRKALSGGL